MISSTCLIASARHLLILAKSATEIAMTEEKCMASSSTFRIND